jgi:hypothetical protein
MENKGKYFFGWTKIKWFITEIGKLYSSKNSFFSKKRIESGLAFVIAQFGMIYFLIKKMDILTINDLTVWAGIEFVVAGYTVAQIQSEKKKNISSDNEEEMIKS